MTVPNGEEVQAALSVQVGLRQDGSGGGMLRQHAAVVLTDLATHARARVRGCRGVHLRRSQPSGAEGGCAVSCGREATVGVLHSSIGRRSQAFSGWDLDIALIPPPQIHTAALAHSHLQLARVAL